MNKRCSWCGDDPLYVKYHDEEWGKPVHDDRVWFEFLLLEGAQAGLSWITILRKRENYRAAFDGFNFTKIALYDDKKVAELMQNAGIVRNKAKICSAIGNARVFLEIIEEFGTFNTYIRGFFPSESPKVPLSPSNFLSVPLKSPLFPSDSPVPTKTPVSEKISSDLKKRGMKFVGPTIIYAFMQATGLVNDHIKGCPAR